MKHLILGILFLFLASGATAQTETDWRLLSIKSGPDVVAVLGATEIGVGTAKTLHDRGAKFVDVRRKSLWKKGHIPGAISLPYPSEAALKEIMDKAEEVVFYCDCAGYSGCNRSPDASARAVAWSAAGYPLERAE